jgi:general stress protein YciG
MRKELLMPGTPGGGLKAAQRNRERHGADFYQRIGREGGKTSRGGGFAADRERAREAGCKGGRVSRRRKKTRQNA